MVSFLHGLNSDQSQVRLYMRKTEPGARGDTEGVLLIHCSAARHPCLGPRIPTALAKNSKSDKRNTSPQPQPGRGPSLDDAQMMDDPLSIPIFDDKPSLR